MKNSIIFFISALLLTTISTVSSADNKFYIPKPNKDVWHQVIDLIRHHKWEDAGLLIDMVITPQSIWFTAGTPDEVRRKVRRQVRRAHRLNVVPVLVAYNIPFRDCAQFSAGGTANAQEYKDWIDGFAAGIGKKKALVILEPDGLGIIPWYTTFEGTLDWCQPAEANPATAAAERFEMFNYAGDALKARPNVTLYLDGTHSGWLNVGDNADRLVKAGVARADGFYLNASNYQYTANLTQYGTWVSQCIAQGGGLECADQYWNGGPEGTAIADLIGPWNGVALSGLGEWSNTAMQPEFNTSGINARYWAAGQTHFIIDTSRNGQGPWAPTASYPDPQDWCNPPGRGVGLKPTMVTGHALIDAYVWIKIPGESDGECTRGLGPAGTTDPEWGIVNPAAGKWFSEQALELARQANPPLH